MRHLWWIALVVGACGKAPEVAVDAATGADGGIPAGWTTLISRPWSIVPGAQNVYRCRRVQIMQDMWISAFRVLAPLGTHHEVVTIDQNDTNVGDYDCTVQSGTLSGEMLYAAGVNTDDLALPTGVAIHVAKGTWVNLNLHLFNATEADLSDESGVLVQTVPIGDVMYPADMTFAGTSNITVTSDGQPQTASGGCNAPTDWHAFALWPHMHQIATHQTVTVTHLGTPTTVLDTDYMFTEQRNYPMPEMVFSQGDRIETTCTYVNNTGSTVYFGDSSLAEMCFTGIYKYPAGTSTLACVDR